MIAADMPTYAKQLRIGEAVEFLKCGSVFTSDGEQCGGEMRAGGIRIGGTLVSSNVFVPGA